jgi:hypothetical protein
MKKRTVKTKVTVKQASTVELSRRNSDNSLTFWVRRGKMLLGVLEIGHGSVQWWPKGNRVASFKMSWPAFVNLLEKEMNR